MRANFIIQPVFIYLFYMLIGTQRKEKRKAGKKKKGRMTLILGK